MGRHFQEWNFCLVRLNETFQEPPSIVDAIIIINVKGGWVVVRWDEILAHFAKKKIEREMNVRFSRMFVIGLSFFSNCCTRILLDK